MKHETPWSLSFRYTAGILFFLAFVAFLFYARDTARSLVVAAFIAYLINPAVVYLANNTRMSRSAAVNIVYFSSLILLVGVPATLAPIFYDEAKVVFKDLLDLTSQLSAMLMQPVQAGNLVFHLEEWGQSLAQLQGAITKPLPKDALHLLETTSVGVLWFLVILVAVYLFLSEWTGLRERMFAFALPPYRAEIQELYRRIRRIWMAYLRGQIVLMIIVGVVFTVTWLILGIPGALALGLIAGLFTLVPDVGPFLAAIIAASVALLEGSTWIPLPNFWVAVILLVVFFVLMTLKNLLLRPLIMGRSVHMHEGIVFIAIIAATVLEGILGALLVVPVLATVIIIAGYLQRRILGLTPFENDGDTQFVAPPEKVNPPRRGSRKFKLLDRTRASSAHTSESPAPTDSTRGKKTNRKKTSV